MDMFMSCGQSGNDYLLIEGHWCTPTPPTWFKWLQRPFNTEVNELPGAKEGLQVDLQSLMTHPADLDWLPHRSQHLLEQLEGAGMSKITGLAHLGCVRVSVYALTQSVLTQWPRRGQTHTASPDNSANPQLPTAKPSILRPADRRIFNISTIYITLSQFHVTHSHPSRSERPCRGLQADCCVSSSSCCRA